MKLYLPKKVALATALVLLLLSTSMLTAIITAGPPTDGKEEATKKMGLEPIRECAREVHARGTSRKSGSQIPQGEAAQ